jgi:hypothetical protein
LLSLTLLDANKAVAKARLTRKAYSDDQLVDETSRAVDELLKSLPAAGPPPPPGAEVARAEPAPPPPAAAAGQPPPGFHQHDGAFLRFQLGFGGLKSTGGDTELSGTAGSFAVGLGLSITDNLVLFGEVFDDVATNPKVKSGGTEIQTSGVTHTLIGYGLGASWYFMPLNAHLGLCVGVGKLGIEVNTAGAPSQTFSTQFGPVVRVSLGKEFWASTNWGIGAALNAERGSMKDSGANPVTFNVTAYSIALTATYN